MTEEEIQVSAPESETPPLADEGRMSFTDHLRELRRRLVISMIAVAAGFGICYAYSEQIFEVMMRPLLEAMTHNEKLIYTDLPEAFFTYLKVGFWGGVILASPVIFHQIWKFVAPGLYRHEKKYLIPFVVFATALFLLGGCFGYYVVFPFGFRFFLGYSTEHIMALPAVKEYFSLALRLLFGFGIIFELPLVMVFMAKMGLVNARMLAKGRKYAILLIFVVSAVLTPPDVVSQVLMSLPLMVLYEISIILVRMVRKKPVDEVLEGEEDSDGEKESEVTDQEDESEDRVDG